MKTYTDLTLTTYTNKSSIFITPILGECFTHRKPDQVREIKSLGI